MSLLSSFIVRFFQQKYTKSLFILGGIVLVGACFGQAAGGPQYTDDDMTKAIIEVFDLIFGLLALVLGPMVILAGWLLSPDWTMGDFFGLRGYFRDVWILVANIVYIIFALILLWMAIAQIFGGAENDYAFKKKLGPFLVGILMVPFTWLIVSWTLSFANQAVAAVLSIPIGSIETGSGNPKSMWHKKVLPTQFDFSANGQSGYGGIGNLKCEGGFQTNANGGQTDKRCISPAEFLTENQSGPFFIMMIYAYNIFKIQEADLQPLQNFCKSEGQGGSVQYESSKSCVKNLMDILRNFGLSLVVTVFFGIMLIALCWVLLMRAIKMWIYIMLSPLFGLAYFTGKGFSETVGEAGESGFGQVGFKQFFKLAMVPVLVAAVLAFGLLFVGVVRDNFHGGLNNTSQTEFCTDKKAGYMVTYCINEVEEQGQKTYYSKLIIGTDPEQGKKDSRIYLNFGNSFGKFIGSSTEASIAAGAVAGGISSVEDIFAHIILTMLALVFMFMGVKVAVQFDAVTEAAFKPFADLGKSVGTFVAHSPSYLPLPHPQFATMMNPKNLTGMVDALRTKYDEKAAAPGRAAAEIFANSAYRNLDTKTANELNRLSSRDGSSQAIFNEQKRRLGQIIQSLPQGDKKDQLERDLRQANTVKEQSILKDIAGTLKDMNENGGKKFLDKEGTIFTNGMATVTTSEDIRQRFDKGNQTYDNGRGSPINLKRSSWTSVAPTHSDSDFRRNNKGAFETAGIKNESEINSSNITRIREELAKSTNNAINFNDWNDVELRNLYRDAQKPQ